MTTKGKHLGGVRTLADIKARCEEVGTCWEWQRYINECHVPQVGYNGMPRPARRVAWEMVNGPTPPGMKITNTCGNHKCVNPDHSKPVHPATILKRNAKSANEALRRARISRTKRKKMGPPPDVITVMQHDHTSPVLELAQRLGVSESTVYKYRRQAATASPWAGLMRI